MPGISRFSTAALAVALAVALAAAVVGCAGTTPGVPDDAEAPWKGSGDTEVITAAPDAGGVLSFRNCPTLEEAQRAMPAIAAGPDANAVPFKSMVLQCSYTLVGLDTQGRPAGISILVFDAEGEGLERWTWEVDPSLGSPSPIGGLGDRAFVTAGRDVELWVDAGRFGLHLLSTGPSTPPLAEQAELARAAVEGLGRPPR